jgi:hypothetical protein
VHTAWSNNVTRSEIKGIFFTPLRVSESYMFNHQHEIKLGLMQPLIIGGEFHNNRITVIFNISHQSNL